jgi:hypothetical protein
MEHFREAVMLLSITKTGLVKQGRGSLSMRRNIATLDWLDPDPKFRASANPDRSTAAKVPI